MEPVRTLLPRRIAMRVWSACAAGRAHLVRPTDTPRAHASGRNALRVLVIGSGPVVGWGVSSHDLALPGAIARALAATTGRGALVDAVLDPSAGVRKLRKMLDDVHVERYDVVVLSAVVNDALHLAPYRRWVARVRSTLETTRRRGPALVVWLGAPPIRSIPLYDSRLGQIAEEHAEWLNAGALGVCREVGAVYVALSAPPIKDATRHRSPADYLLWGRQIVDALAPSIEERLPQPTSSTHNGADGGDRVDAIRRLRLTEHANDSRLERLVGTAKRTLGTGSAMFTLLDDEKEWPLAWVGRGFAEIPIDQSACIHTIAAPDGMYVANAADDERFASAALVTGPAGLRYYAGYPVEAPDGTRIGALCVFDRTPRDADQGEADLEVLRELALLAQRELWRWEPER